MSSAYLRLLIFLLEILIPACASSSLVFQRMYSVYKLYKGDNIQMTYSFPNFEPVRCFMSSSNCCFLTCMQVSQEARKVVWGANTIDLCILTLYPVTLLKSLLIISCYFDRLFEIF